jgi:hypothetical protein
VGVAGLVVSVACLVVGIAALYLGFVQVPGILRRCRPVPPPTQATYDVFISYAETDRAHAERLAAGLRGSGIRPFLAAWVGPGLVEQLEKERALAAAADAILLFSRATMREPAIRDEYAAMLRRVHSGGRRFIPVLVEEVELPPFAAIRKPLDRGGRRRAEVPRLAGDLVTWMVRLGGG